MELKLDYDLLDCSSRICINCTVVELKHWSQGSEETSIIVLIVPLWNWNTFEVKVLRFVYDVLIVPLWNWNDWRGRFRWFGHGINCTVVELKLSEASTGPSPVILVLIVPLWNWNLFLTLTYNNEHLRINCTVVELKQLT